MVHWEKLLINGLSVLHVNQYVRVCILIETLFKDSFGMAFDNPLFLTCDCWFHKLICTWRKFYRSYSWFSCLWSHQHKHIQIRKQPGGRGARGFILPIYPAWAGLLEISFNFNFNKHVDKQIPRYLILLL